MPIFPANNRPAPILTNEQQLQAIAGADAKVAAEQLADLSWVYSVKCTLHWQVVNVVRFVAQGATVAAAATAWQAHAATHTVGVPPGRGE